MTYEANVLIVDDEPSALRVLSAILRESGYRVHETLDVDAAIKVLEHANIDAVITDLKMPGKDGLQLFKYIAESRPHLPVIFLTAYGSVESAVDAMHMGIFHYFIKPPDYGKLRTVLAKSIEQHNLKKEIEKLRHDAAERRLPSIVGKTSSMASIFRTIETIKDSESSVLICGETGTGKELIAKHIHFNGKRQAKPFVAINCAAIPRELVESEIFGYEKGAFTGATATRVGKFEEAGDGTVFLDEIGELEPSVQVKLLRALQEREIERLGNNRRIKVNFRLISSTNRDLAKEIKAGAFREDLFYRLDVMRIEVPPLRERKDDIPLLVGGFCVEFCMRENKTLSVSDAVMDVFMNYSWPGNIRQLKNVVERAVVLATGDTITLKELPDELLSGARKAKVPVGSAKSLKELEVLAIRDALERFNGNKSKAARTLGISRKAFYKRLKDHDIG